MRIFELADLDYYMENDLDWRLHKVKEMIWCCQLMLNNDAIDKVLQESVKYFLNLVNTDSNETYNYPLDLIRATYKTLLQKNTFSNEVENLIELMEILNLTKEYKKEFDLFQLTSQKRNLKP